MPAKEDQHGYQFDGSEYIHNNLMAWLWVEMGLGKTIMCLSAIEDLMYDFEVGRVLLLAPKKVAVNVWSDEVKEWDHIKRTRVNVMVGDKKKRLKSIKINNLKEINTINVDQTHWVVSYILHLKKHGIKNPFDCLIIDESSCFKTSASSRFVALKQIITSFDRVIMLTGTPTPNGYLNLWAQMYLLDQGELLGRTFGDYKRRFFYMVDSRGRKFKLKPGAATEIKKLLKDRVFKLREKDWLNLPPFNLVTRKIDLSNKLKADYKRLEKEFILDFWKQKQEETPGILPQHIRLTADFRSQLNNLLTQFSNGAVYNEPGSKEFTVIHDQKLDELEDIVAESQGEPILLAYAFISDRVRILERFPQAEVLDDDPETINRWNRGEIEMLVTHPASASHGLNLQKGGNICVWFGLTWNLEHFLQFNKRLHRQGQLKPVSTFLLCCAGTIDVLMKRVLLGKKRSQDELIDSIEDHVINIIKKSQKFLF